MVFESLVADLLNKYLGQYVANLDSSQLSIGIWGGDVQLKNLQFKESTLDDLQLPIKCISGSIGNLTLKIPWNNLYNAPVVAAVENLNLLVVPNTEVYYNKAKEDRLKQEAKLASLRKHEEAKKQEKEKDKPKPNDTFTEKLAAQIINNIQISIKDIHIRFEDHNSNKGKPFAFGLTLSSLMLESVTKNMNDNIPDFMLPFVTYKNLSINNVCFYWNNNTQESFIGLSDSELQNAFKDAIKGNKTYHYMLGPIFSTCNLRLNSKPDIEGTNYTIPKALLILKLKDLVVRISKAQYQDILAMLESFDYLNRGIPYRKYRPSVKSYKGHYKEWWMFAFKSILHAEVRRQHNNWDWMRMKTHRQACKEYGTAYMKKLTTPNPSKELIQSVVSCEKHLDVLNIVLVREKIEHEMARKGLSQNSGKSSSWLKKWWSAGPGASDDEEDSDIKKKFQEAMTSEEKKKLYRAIGYQENALPTQYPVKFVAVTLDFTLEKLEVEVRDESSQVLDVTIQNVNTVFNQRPAGQAWQLSADIQNFLIKGLQQGEFFPELVQSKVGEVITPTSYTASQQLLHIVVEVKPLREDCDMLVHILSQPLQFVYDAQTINKVIDVFTVEENSVISRFNAAVQTKLKEFKEKSALGLQYAISQHLKMAVEIDLMGCYCILPYGGLYTGKSQSKVGVNLGRMLINCEPKSSAELDIQSMHKRGSSDDDILKMMLSSSYDKFVVQLREAQIQMMLPGETWKSSSEGASDQYILEPTNFTVTLEKCLVAEDLRLPKFKVYGSLPSINIRIGERRLFSAIDLFFSIPFSDTSSSTSYVNVNLPSPQKFINIEEITKSAKPWRGVQLPADTKSNTDCESVVDSDFSADSDFSVESDYTTVLSTNSAINEPLVQFTTLDLKFELKEISVSLFRKKDEGTEQPLADFRILSLEAELIQQTHNLSVSLRLGGLSLCQHYNGDKVHIINTPMAEGRAEYLMVVTLIKVNKSNPEFHTVHHSVKNNLALNFTKLDMLLHLEAIVDAMKWGNEVNEFVADILSKQESSKEIPVRPATPTIRPASPTKSALQMTTTAVNLLFDETSPTSPLGSKSYKDSKELIRITTDMKIKAQMGEVSLTLRNNQRMMGAMHVIGGTFELKKTAFDTSIYATLNNFDFIDLRENTLHPKVLSVKENKMAIEVKIKLFPMESSLDMVQNEKHNMILSAKIACVRVVFLNYVVASILDFLNTFTAAKVAVQEVSAAAKANMQQVCEAAFRMRLKIYLEAPIIVIPANSMSRDAVVLDFGVLRVKSRMKEIREELVSVLIDNVKLVLKNLTIRRVKFGENMEWVAICPLLEPVSFNLEVKRNVTGYMPMKYPDLFVSGNLESIHVKLAQEDLSMILSIITQNLGEVPETTTDVVSGTLTTPIQFDSENSELLLVIQYKTKIPLDKAKIKEGPKVVKAHLTEPTISFKFNFTLDSLVIDLFRSSEKVKEQIDPPKNCPCPPTEDPCPPTEDPCPPTDSPYGLARFTLQVFSVDTIIKSDGCITVTAQLLDCLLDDTRSSREGKICRYMERHPDQVIGKTPMLDINFTKSANSIDVRLQVFKFNLILNIEHLMSISDFFMSCLKQQTASATAQMSKTTRAMGNQFQTVLKESAAAAIATQAGTEESSANTRITVYLETGQSDIILVENLDDINTNAIIMNNEIKFKIMMESGVEDYNGYIKNFQLFSCCFNPKRRKETKAQILRPVTVYLVGHKGESTGYHLDISTTNIHVSVSPGTLELLSGVMATVAAVKQNAPAVEEEEHDYSDIWNIGYYNEVDYWFLRPEFGEDVSQTTDTERKKVFLLNEICMFKVPKMWITLEAGLGNKTLPLLLIEYNLQASIHSWSSLLNAEATMSLQVSYYNSRLALWEPLIEPVEIAESNNSTHLPWELTVLVETNDTPKSEENDLDFGEGLLTKPKRSINFTSKETMELTITKTSLEVMKNLQNAFNNAIFKPESKSIAFSAPYVVQNDLGVNVKVLLKNEGFKVFNQDGLQYEVEEVVLESETSVNLCPVEEDDRLSVDLSSEKKLQLVRQMYLPIKVLDPPCDLDLPVAKADKRYFSLQYRPSGNDTWGIVSDVQVTEGSTVITLRGILQIFNHLSIPVSVYFLTKKGDEIELVGKVQPHKRLNLPLRAIYTPTTKLFFRAQGYALSNSPFVWKDLQNSLVISTVLQCNHKNPETIEPYFIQAVGELEQIYFGHSNRHTMSSIGYNIHLRPTIVLKNFLPVSIEVSIQGIPTVNQIPSGERLQVPHAEPGNSTMIIKIPDYLDREWICQQDILTNPPELSVWTFRTFDFKIRYTLNLGVHFVNEYGTIKLMLYSPFWFLNKTNLILHYRKSNKTGNEDNEANSQNSQEQYDNNNFIFHPKNYKGPIMFSFRGKSFFGKKKASIMVNDGEWSEKFSIDAAGNSGVVLCKTDDLTYKIGVSVQLMYNSLTKLVTFTPYYIVVNECKLDVELQEASRISDPWHRVKAGEVNSFWPRECSDKVASEMTIRMADTKESTVFFDYNCTFNYMLKLENKFGGLEVHIQKTEGAVYITIKPYHPGMAPALLINHSQCVIRLNEKGGKPTITLLPGQEKMFTWTAPKNNHVLNFCEEYSTELKKDEVGNLNITSGPQLYWVSFLDGLQRVLLFTTDPNVVREAESASDMESVDLEIIISIHGVGLSLVDNEALKEIIYLSISSSGIVWEFAKPGSKRYKKIKPKDSLSIEEDFSKYKLDLLSQDSSEGSSRSSFIINNSFEVDFAKNEIVKPNKRVIRRTFNEGLWLMFRMSPHQLQIHAKINRLQIDNQMHDCEFPVIFAPVPPPKSVSVGNENKPFVEFSLLNRLNKHSSLVQFKYFKVLIQEFEIKVDLGLIDALAKMFEAGTIPDNEEAELFARDVVVANDPLTEHVNQLSSNGIKNHFDHLHFSPLKIHVSFSLNGEGSKVPQIPLLSVLIQTFGVTVANVQDIVLKLSYFERNYTLLSTNQLISQAKMHYMGQLLKQFYVLALGLDVMGNPYGLVIGITEGVGDLFYEPFQGMIQGPGEFAEGLVLGVRSLFGHTVGGAAGAVSRITGAMGKGIAALSMDEDYQRKRREALNYRPTSIQEGIAHSGKGLVMSVVEGVGGVFTKPVSGARHDGVGGFVKGVGKGMMGLVTRPTAGVIDFASGSFNAVRRVTDLGVETTRMRQPRFLDQDHIVRPYCKQEALGNKLLKELEKGKYYMTDVYAHHIPLSSPRKILLLTDKRMIVLSHNDIFGGNQVDFSYVWEELAEPPVVVKDGVQIKLEEVKKKLGFFHKKDTKILPIQKDEDKKLIVEKISSLMGAISPKSSFRRGSCTSTGLSITP